MTKSTAKRKHLPRETARFCGSTNRTNVPQNSPRKRGQSKFFGQFYICSLTLRRWPACALKLRSPMAPSLPHQNHSLYHCAAITRHTIATCRPARDIYPTYFMLPQILSRAYWLHYYVTSKCERTSPKSRHRLQNLPLGTYHSYPLLII